MVKNWDEFQHYKKRNPPWIKLHRALNEDHAFAGLKDKTKAHLMLIWILASSSEGRIPHDAKFVGARINALEPVDLEAMIAAGFLIADGGAEPAPQEKHEKNPELRKQAAEIISFLNDKAGRNYDLNGANSEHVMARLRDGETMDDLRAVIAKKCREWKGDDKMNKFLRPETLFNRTKFASYKGELIVS